MIAPIQETDRAEFVGQLLDIFEDFLEEKHIEIENPEKLEDENLEDAAILYGSDYNNLQTTVENTLINWQLLNTTTAPDTDAALLERPLDTGLTFTEILSLARMIREDEMIPIEIESATGESTAMGFIGKNAFERINFKKETLSEPLGKILSDMSLETDDHMYHVGAIQVFMSR